MDTPSDKPVDLGLGGDTVVSAPTGSDPASVAEANQIPAQAPSSTPSSEPSTVENLVPPVVVVPEESKAKKAASGVLKMAPVVIGPMILAISLAYSFNRAVSAPGSVNITSKAATEATVKVTDMVSITPEIAAKWRTILNNVPKNPDTVVATASVSGKAVTLVSGKGYDYQRVTFSWSGDRAVEPGTKIKGYYVYFGSKSTEIPFPINGNGDSVWPSKDGIFVKSNSYTARNLTKGRTYYLYVQSVSDSTVPYQNLGMEEVAAFQTLQARKLFTYIYQ